MGIERHFHSVDFADSYRYLVPVLVVFGAILRLSGRITLRRRGRTTGRLLASIGVRLFWQLIVNQILETKALKSFANFFLFRRW